MLLTSKNARSLCTALSCMVLSVCAIAVGAEQNQALGAVDASPKQAPPAPMPPRPLKLPQPVTYKLPNGLTVVLLEDHHVPFVTFELGIKSGEAHDPKDLPGLASTTADMLTEGTDKYTSKQIASTIDSIGGALHGSTDKDFTYVIGSVLSKNQSELLDVMSNVVMHPSFPEDELKLEKANLQQELTMKRSNPGFLAEERFSKVVYGNHPYSNVSATPQSVEKFDRNVLAEFHKTHYLPNLSTLVVVGDIQTAPFKQLIEKDLGGWQSASAPAQDFANAPSRSGSMIYLVDRPGSVQSSLRLGNLAIRKTDPDYFKALVANQVLGGSPMSRLFVQLREKKGYTYGAYSGFTSHLQPGTFAATAEVRTPVTAPSLKEFLTELDRIRTAPPTDAELTAAKNYLIGTFQTGFETQSSIAQRLLECQLYNLPKDYLATYTDKVMAVTPQDVQQVAQKYMDLKNLAIVVVGDAKKIEPELKEFAPIEVYDINGKLVRTATILTPAKQPVNRN